MEEQMSKGIIYITTTSVRGLVKIGKTASDNFSSRMAVLEQNGYWNVNGLKRYFAVEVDDYDEKEKLLHTIFSKSQVSTSELFALDKDLAVEVLKSFNGKQVYPEAKTKHKTKGLRLSFDMLSIPIGTPLYYTEDEDIVVTTADNATGVYFQGEVYKLSGLVKKLHNDEGHWRGGYYFTIDGNKTLVDLFNDMFAD